MCTWYTKEVRLDGNINKDQPQSEKCEITFYKIFYVKFENAK